MNSEVDQAIKDAIEAGFDLNLIEINLSLPPEERWRQHDMALEVILALENARIDRDARLQPPARPSR